MKIEGPIMYFRWFVYLDNTVWKEGVANNQILAEELAFDALRSAEISLKAKGYNIQVDRFVKRGDGDLTKIIR
jgi:hypothetical protein